MQETCPAQRSSCWGDGGGDRAEWKRWSRPRPEYIFVYLEQAPLLSFSPMVLQFALRDDDNNKHYLTFVNHQRFFFYFTWSTQRKGAGFTLKLQKKLRPTQRRGGSTGCGHTAFVLVLELAHASVVIDCLFHLSVSLYFSHRKWGWPYLPGRILKVKWDINSSWLKYSNMATVSNNKVKLETFTKAYKDTLTQFFKLKK